MTEGVESAIEESGTRLETAAWEEPSRPAPLGTAPTLSVEGFEGPLDWLLELAQARRIDLARLSIGALVEAFAAAMEAALAQRNGTPSAGLGRWGVNKRRTGTLAEADLLCC